MSLPPFDLRTSTCHSSETPHRAALPTITPTAGECVLAEDHEPLPPAPDRRPMLAGLDLAVSWAGPDGPQRWRRRRMELLRRRPARRVGGRRPGRGGGDAVGPRPADATSVTERAELEKD